MDTQGPILASFSKPSTNSAMILNICQESVTFISCQFLFSNACLILSSLVIPVFLNYLIVDLLNCCECQFVLNAIVFIFNCNTEREFYLNEPLTFTLRLSAP